MKAHSTAKPEHSRHHGSSDRSGHGHGQQATAVVDNRPEMEQQQGLLSLMAGSPRLQRKCACGAPSEAGGSCADCEAKAIGASSQVLQKKLAIGATDDPLEREADRVMRLEALGQTAQGSSIEGEGCRERKKKRFSLQRWATTYQNEVAEVPPIVNEVLNSPGQPLDPETRAFMEPRFGYDFSQVRVHSDTKAAQSAQAVNSLAYTVKRDIVFGEGQYAPGRISGQRLIAHELTHVAQQASAVPSLARLEIGVRDSQAEREADDMAYRIVAGKPFGSIRSEEPILRKQDAIDFDLVPTPPEEAELLKKQGVNLPIVSKETWDIINNKAGTLLAEIEKRNIEAHLKKDNVSTGTSLATPLGSARFLLHDTSAPVGKTKIAEEAKLGRGPLGAGVSAWVSRDTDATIARPNFYESRRPTTTELEKSSDVLNQENREQDFRQVWKAAKATEQTTALNNVLAGQGLTPKEIAEEQTSASKQLNATSGKTFTTAGWAVEDICNRLSTVGVKAMASSDKKETDLIAGCATLTPFFAARNRRVGSTVAVEIVQKGAKTSKGNQNTCDPNNPNIDPLDTPPYTDRQYVNVMNLYLRAALMAGRFPEIITHFAVDAFAGGHCDPRCFNLGKLYELIAASMGHPKGASYGIQPSYGLKSGTNNVWWSDKICHGSHP